MRQVIRSCLAVAIVLSALILQLLVGPAELCHQLYSQESSMVAAQGITPYPGPLLSPTSNGSRVFGCRLITYLNADCRHRNVRPQTNASEFCLQLPEMRGIVFCVALVFLLFLAVLVLTLATEDQTMMETVVWSLGLLSVGLIMIVILLVADVQLTWGSFPKTLWRASRPLPWPRRCSRCIDWAMAGTWPPPQLPIQWYIAFMLVGVLFLLMIVMMVMLKFYKGETERGHAGADGRHGNTPQQNQRDNASNDGQPVRYEVPPPAYNSLFPQGCQQQRCSLPAYAVREREPSKLLNTVHKYLVPQSDRHVPASQLLDGSVINV